MRLILLILLLPTLAQAASLRTLTNQLLTGDISFADGQLLLTQKGPPPQPPQSLNLDDILRLDFRSTPAPAARWRGIDIGTHVRPGSDRLVGATATISAGGVQMWGTNQDHFRFVFQPLAGDGQIVARVLSVNRSSDGSKAGIMFRATIDQASPHAFVCAVAGNRDTGGYAAMLCRPKNAVPTFSRDDRDSAGVPVWLRLRRAGNKLTGYVSADGNDWRQILETDVALPPTALVGLGVSAHTDRAICTASFEKIQVTATDAAADIKPFSRGVELRDGSHLAAHIRSANDSTIRLYRDRDGEFPVPLTDISRIRFNPPTREASVKLSQSAGKTGVVLTSGDFFEGNITAIDNSRITVSSVLFGLKHYDTGQVVAVLLRDPVSAPAKYDIRPLDGSLIFADTLKFEKNQLVVSTRLAGNLRFLSTDLVDIVAGAARRPSLVDLKPARVDAPSRLLTPAYTPDATTAGLPLALGGAPAERGIGLAAGTTLTYALDGAYRMLILRLGVPDGVLPTNPVRFTLAADGKELFQSPPLTALDDPIPLTLPLAGVKQLTIRLDAALPHIPGGGGVLADPVVVK